jgi:hypothetical protein
MEYRHHPPEQTGEGVPDFAGPSDDPRETGSALQPVIVSRPLPSYDMLPITKAPHASVEQHIGDLATNNPEHVGDGTLEPPSEPPRTTFGEAGDAEEPFGVRRFTPSKHLTRWNR